MVAFPAWLSKPGSPDAFVKDAAGLAAALQQGYSYPTAATTAASASAPVHTVVAGTPVTPRTVVAKSGALTTTISEISVNGEQDDGSGNWGGGSRVS